MKLKRVSLSCQCSYTYWWMGRVQLQVAVFLLKDKNALQRRHNLNIQVSLHWADVKNEKVLIMSVTRLDSNSSEPQRELQIQSGSKHLLNPPFMKCLWRGRYCLEMLLLFGNLYSFISSTFFDWEALEQTLVCHTHPWCHLFKPLCTSSAITGW